MCGDGFAPPTSREATELLVTLNRIWELQGLVVTELLVDLRDRGLDVTRPMLVGLDGSKALRKAVLDVLDHPVIQRCHLHLPTLRAALERESAGSVVPVVHSNDVSAA